MEKANIYGHLSGCEQDGYRGHGFFFGSWHSPLKRVLLILDFQEQPPLCVSRVV